MMLAQEIALARRHSQTGIVDVQSVRRADFKSINTHTGCVCVFKYSSNTEKVSSAGVCGAQRLCLY